MESNLLSQINAATPLPTFIETYLARSTNSTLHDFFVFAHQMLADRSRVATVTLPYSSELFYALWTLLEWNMLRVADSTFAEYIFGLKRVHFAGFRPEMRLAEVIETPFAALRLRPLTMSGKLWSVFLQGLLPYIRLLLSRRYTKLTDRSDDAVLQRSAEERRSPFVRQLNRLIETLFPVLQFSLDGATFAYEVAYLLEKSPFLSPLLHLNKIVVRRLTSLDGRKLQSSPAAKRVLMLAQMLLLVIMLGFRYLEWRSSARSSSASGLEAEGVAGTVPPPPMDDQLSLPPGATLPPHGECPVCKREIVNPAVNSATGIVCCFPCLQQFIREHGRCPVTNNPTVLQSIRRLFEA